MSGLSDKSGGDRSSNPMANKADKNLTFTHCPSASGHPSSPRALNHSRFSIHTVSPRKPQQKDFKFVCLDLRGKTKTVISHLIKVETHELHCHSMTRTQLVWPRTQIIRIQSFPKFLFLIKFVCLNLLGKTKSNISHLIKVQTHEFHSHSMSRTQLVWPRTQKNSKFS